MESDLKASWYRLCDTLKESVDYVFDPALGVDSSEQAEGLRHHLRLFFAAVERLMENNDPDHPELGWAYPSKTGQDNPDALYMTAPLDLRHSYRLTGRIDTPRYLGLSLMDFRFGRGTIQQILNIGSPDLTDIGGGRMDIVFSPEPDPGDHLGDWYQLEPHQCRLLVRQFFSDWATEQRADLHLECLDPGAPPARLDPLQFAGTLDEIAAEMSIVPKFWTDYAVSQRDRGEINSFEHMAGRKVSGVGYGGSDQQAYGQCWYEVGAQEALLLEVTPPKCWYWNIQVGDTWFQSLDYMNLPATLNDSQAHIDPDGVLRVAISHVDPGTCNWISLGGCPQGAITYRWNNADSVPVPSLRLMPVSEVAEHLHPDSPRVTPQDRRQRQAERRRHGLNRFTR
ncbi:MAG: hypothetical protein F4Z58_09115 [Acidimicrobiaceae bacterium]|nr:hypothetical protein [Acidimicrobiaceae bacterium]MXW76184.1 hypothetical protein [Acidimicrobiaceae bacterium]MYC41782.1 hypothetical protein [Acidimicrobiaceae bacterium]MYD07532.1 hypothetical protein [Acidimicrobiaceae bacterium]MYH88194.1 hypothetical protein [Acidimicrobiaceae bacterium]